MLTVDTRDAMLAAFGTVWNTYRQLDLSDADVSFPTFARACRGATIAPEVLSAILVCWEHRRRQPVSV